jgi:hypothetical protein
VNLAGARLLGLERSRLVGKRVGLCVSEADLLNGEAVACERLAFKPGLPQSEPGRGDSRSSSASGARSSPFDEAALIRGGVQRHAERWA